jgi:hypothetical protein
MENQPLQTQTPPKSDQQMLAEILENSRKTKNYMKWQLIITVALVILPLLATVAIIPFVLNSVTSVYGGGGLDSGSMSEIQDLLK